MSRTWRAGPSAAVTWKACVVLGIICAFFRLSIDWKTVGSVLKTTESCRPPSTTSSSATKNATADDGNARSTAFPPNNPNNDNDHIRSQTILYSSTDTNNIAPGELPGYTGWGRPEHTLAKFFSVVQTTTSSDGGRGDAGRQDLVITVRCQGHDDCLRDSSLFFLRAYGPAVLPGTVENRGDGLYAMEFRVFDPGRYTVEVVLTYSTSPAVGSFPLPPEQAVPAYEGFLLPGFPLVVTVPGGDGAGHGVAPPQDDPQQMCTFDDLVERSAGGALATARWRVTGRSNGRGHPSSASAGQVSLMGYKAGVNSLGITMEYQHLGSGTGCALLPESAFSRHLQDRRVFARCPRKIQIIYIGDSVLRVQMDMLRRLANRVTTVELTFLSLHGGYRRNQILGPSDVRAFLDERRTKNPDDARVVLFNTGLHDIHQLCGPEFADDRLQYLDRAKLDAGSFSCLEEYRVLLKEFVELVKEFPAQLKVFQTTTAAWPKYGNWGIEWEHHPQTMPLVSDFSAAFNDVAHEVLADYKEDGIEIMDGYWITYPRPDNREIGAIGNKLSHPGFEVLSAMARIWTMVILDRAC